MKKTGIVIGIIAAIAFIAAVWVAGYYFYKTKGPAKTMSVVGLAEQDFESDLIVWDLNYSVRNMNMKDAYSLLKEQNNVVKEYLKSKGLGEDEMIFNAVTHYADNDWEWNEAARRSFEVFKGYVLTQSIRIESTDVEKVEKISREVTELLDQGIQIDGNNVSYYYTKLADLKIEMLANATKDARNRAETIAKNAGSSLGGLKTANMGVFQITAPNSADEDYSWGGTFNTSSKQKRASINMKLTYYVR
ncbi:MAG: SIMPL domain-containing protein [Bacteroidales bacterium]|nr:SIMPL domain-containing protein [Bacteroidales bacterium]